MNAHDHDLLSAMYEVMAVCKSTCTATAGILHVDGQVNSSAMVEHDIK